MTLFKNALTAEEADWGLGFGSSDLLVCLSVRGVGLMALAFIGLGAIMGFWDAACFVAMSVWSLGLNM